MSFKMRDTTHLLSLDMSAYTLHKLHPGQPSTFKASTPCGTKQSVEDFSPKTEFGGCTGSTQAVLAAAGNPGQMQVRPSTSQATGIPMDFEAMQPKARPAKKRRVSGGNSQSSQTTEETSDLSATLSQIRKLLMENTVRCVSFNHITEEYCQLERLQMMSVAADANQAYTKVLKNFPNILVGGSMSQWHLYRP